MLSEEEKNDLIDLMTATLISVVEKREGEKKPDQYIQIKKFYENLINSSKNQERIYKSLSFINDHLSNGGELFFVNKKVWGKKNFDGIFMMEIENEQRPMGIQAIEKNVLYDLYYKDEEILTVNKNTPKDIIMEAFAYNNLYLLPQQILPFSSLFSHDTSEKHNDFWKHILDLSRLQIDDFDKKTNKLKEYIKGVSENSILCEIKEIKNQMGYLNFKTNTMSLNSAYMIRHFLSSLFSKKPIAKDKLDSFKNFEYSEHLACFPILDDSIYLSAFLCKDFISNLYNKEIGNEEIALLDIFLTKYIYYIYIEGKSGIEKNFNEVIKFLSSENNKNALIKKTSIYQLLEGMEERLMYFNLSYDVNEQDIIKSIPFLENNNKKNILIYANRFHRSLENKEFKCYVNRLDFLNEFTKTLMRKKMLKNILENFNTNKNVKSNLNYKLSIDDNYYVLETKSEINQKYFEESLKEVVKILIEIEIKKKSSLRERVFFEQLNNEFKKVFDEDLLMKKTREKTLNDLLGENTENKARKKI